MNAKHREHRVRQAEDAHDLALHHLARAREALDLIASIAEAPLVHGSLSSIARLAHAALVGSMPADPAYVSGEQHEQEGP
ncbi:MULTISPECIES: hypothetical protein [unclassified Paraburkholderia]|uniref:hypothetical protein n=1 Tax=unclassified Paraburkholderia TaxID=2615204 RepID=UPI00161C0FC1|nr:MULTISPECIES: hypothetical protein [unclassified Paraburkholderia]MBB5442938.1 hypothetical protein [Paraburkholderia sp. WSM4177]MBB5483457.1 hypothetical protein [Paraburkholderia sp. WSM4180]